MAPTKLLKFPDIRSARFLLCENSPDPGKNCEVLFRSPDQREVYLAGNFNRWNPLLLPMIQGDDGTWRVRMQLSPGRYEFKISAQGEWREEGTCQVVFEVGSYQLILKPDRIINVFGTRNYVFWVK